VVIEFFEPYAVIEDERAGQKDNLSAAFRQTTQFLQAIAMEQVRLFEACLEMEPSAQI
jgi:hypothetical protein